MNMMYNILVFSPLCISTNLASKSGGSFCLNFNSKHNNNKRRSVCCLSPEPGVVKWCFNGVVSVAIGVALIAPLSSPALPFINSKTSPPSSSSSSTPFSQAQNLATGLENGKIRACPSINPGCISSNPMSSNFAFPWRIVGYSSDRAALQQLQDAIMKTQKNVKIQAFQETATGKYLRAEVDGGFSRDVMEFLVNGDVVSFRSMATKVTYVYPFTTAVGDSKGQEQRLKRIVDELEWYAPSFDFDFDF